jgi:hypothetical protein
VRKSYSPIFPVKKIISSIKEINNIQNRPQQNIEQNAHSKCDVIDFAHPVSSFLRLSKFTKNFQKNHRRWRQRPASPPTAQAVGKA